jgi:hypothetical protein
MIKMDKFLISKRPYAVDLSSMQSTWHERRYDGLPPPNSSKGSWHCTIQAVWFRRRNGLTVSCIGDLWDIQNEAPLTAVEMLERHDDGRYGGNARGRWDGESYWGNVTLAEQNKHLEILRPMLAHYPEVPPGFFGWWRF